MQRVVAGLRANDLSLVGFLKIEEEAAYEHEWEALIAECTVSKPGRRRGMNETLRGSTYNVRAVNITERMSVATRFVDLATIFSKDVVRVSTLEELTEPPTGLRSLTHQVSGGCKVQHIQYK